jgi:hypothetical protein
LEDPFASNLEPFPWLNLQISMGEREVEERGEGVFTVLEGVNAGE